MKVTIISNFLNHHQLPLCHAFYRILGTDFKFIATESLPAERKALGYKQMNDQYDFCIEGYKDSTLAEKMVFESDVVIAGYGSIPYEYLKRRIARGKLTFLHSERIFKKQEYKTLSLKRKLGKLFVYHRVNKKNVYMLCASAFLPNDLAKLHVFKNRMFKWGYFPVLSEKSIAHLLELKNSTTTELVWIGRFIEWKHPEMAIYAMESLVKCYNKNVHLTMVGTGQLLGECQKIVADKELDQFISFTGSMPFDSVRSVLEKAHVLFSTSDQNEGWGAVVNEGMGAGCVPVVARRVGAAGYLIKNGHNGLLFDQNNIQCLVQCIISILDKPDKMRAMAQNAYAYIHNEWNAESVSNRLLQIVNRNMEQNLFVEGPLSKADLYIEREYPIG